MLFVRVFYQVAHSSFFEVLQLSGYINNKFEHLINFIMNQQYRNQFNSALQPRNISDNLQHYRIEIKNLKQSLKRVKNEYDKKVQELQSQLKHQKNHIFQKAPSLKPAVNNSNQIQKKDEMIKQLKRQNTILKQTINNPDHILIKKQNNLQLLTEKDNEINRLKKVLLDIQGRYDGQFFNEHKINKQYQMLLKQNESLRQHIKTIENQQRRIPQQGVSTEVMESINYKKQFELANKENDVLKKRIYTLQQALQSNARKADEKKSKMLAIDTQIQEMKLEVKQFKSKNSLLQQRVNYLSKQNEKLLVENKRLTESRNKDSKNLENQGENKEGTLRKVGRNVEIGEQKNIRQPRAGNQNIPNQK